MSFWDLFKFLYAMIIMLLTLISSASLFLGRTEFTGFTLCHGMVNTFVSGIFFASALMNFLPDSDQEIKEHLGPDFDFPLGYLSAIITFSLNLLIEKIILDTHNHHGIDGHGNPTIQAKEKHFNIVMGNQLCSVHKDHFMHGSQAADEVSAGLLNSSQGGQNSAQLFPLECDYRKTTAENFELSLQNLVSAKHKIGEIYLMYSELEERKLQNADKAKKKGQPVQKGSAHGLPIILESPDHNEEGQPQSFGVERKSKWSFYWMLFAISIQAVFVGFGFAVQQFKYGIMFAAITIAMALQKWIEGLTIGWSFRKNGISLKPTLEYTLIYSLATPVGIIIGLLLAEYKMARGILMGIGGGTFIYISAVENMNLEFVTAKFSHRMLKYLTLVAGFLLICGCQFWEVRITGGSS